MPVRGAADRKQRDEAHPATPSITTRRPPCTTATCASPKSRLDVAACSNARRGEQQHVAEQVIEPTPAPADDDDALRAVAHARRRSRVRDRSRPWPSGCRSIAAPPRPPRRRRRDRPSRGRRRCDRPCKPSGAREVQTRVGGDDVGRRQADVRAAPAVDRSRRRPVRARHAAVIVPPSAGITRSRFEGSVAVRARTSLEPPSQPGSPELPMGCLCRVRTRAVPRTPSVETRRCGSQPADIMATACRSCATGSRGGGRRRTAITAPSAVAIQ